MQSQLRNCCFICSIRCRHRVKEQLVLNVQRGLAISSRTIQHIIMVLPIQKITDSSKNGIFIHQHRCLTKKSVLLSEKINAFVHLSPLIALTCWDFCFFTWQKILKVSVYLSFLYSHVVLFFVANTSMLSLFTVNEYNRVMALEWSLNNQFSRMNYCCTVPQIWPLDHDRNFPVKRVPIVANVLYGNLLWFTLVYKMT